MKPVARVCYECLVLLTVIGCVSTRGVSDEERVAVEVSDEDKVDDVLFCYYCPPQENTWTQDDIDFIRKEFGDPKTVSPGAPRANRFIWYPETLDGELRNPFLVMFGQDSQFEESQYLYQEPSNDPPSSWDYHEAVVWKVKAGGGWHVVATRNSSWNSSARDEHPDLFRATCCGWESFAESQIFERFGTPNHIATGTVENICNFLGKGKDFVAGFSIPSDMAVKELFYQNQCDELYFWLVEVRDVGWLVFEDWFDGMKCHFENYTRIGLPPCHPSELPPFMTGTYGCFGCPVRKEMRLKESKRLQEKERAREENRRRKTKWE